MTRDQISAMTAFDHGEMFDSTEQVRAYFTVENIAAMFGPEDGATVSQADLDAMAEAVIANGWHMRDLTLAEAAVTLGVDPSTLRHAIADGRLAATKRGRDYAIRPNEVARYDRERRPRPART